MLAAATPGVPAFALFALMLIALGMPLRLRLVPPNALYGVRLPVTDASRDAWYAVNAYGGSQFVGCGIALLVLALPFLFWRAPEWVDPLVPAPFLLSALVPVLTTVRFAGRYKRDAESPRRPRRSSGGFR